MSWPVESMIPANPMKFADMELAPLPKHNFPVGSTFQAYVTNVHNVAGLRFFVIVQNDENARFLERMRSNTKSPDGHKCTRIPREGVIFGISYGGKSNVLRAVRLPTICFTTKSEIILPDLGRKEIIDEKDWRLEMYHLPIDLRKPSSMAICCQLHGINDDVTIVPNMLREMLPGLRYQSLKLRVDGYIGAVLKVQLLDVKYEVLKNWRATLDDEHVEEDKNGFFHALLNFPSGEKESKIDNDNVEQEISDKENTENESEASFGLVALFSEETDTRSSTPFTWSTTSIETIVPAATINNIEVRPILGDGKALRHSLATAAAAAPLRPLLGPRGVQKMPSYLTRWKYDAQPTVIIVDKRSNKHEFPKNTILTITPTYIGQLERFFGVIHEPGKPYMQHMWTDDEIGMVNRYNYKQRPLLFDIVLAKHCSDFNWYRAKVVEVLQSNDKVRVFFVDFGGECYVKLKNIARLTRRIAEMPFQASLFRLHGLYDVTTSITEHAFAVSILQKVLLKENIRVRVVKCEQEEITIRFDDVRCLDLPDLLVRKGLMSAPEFCEK